MILALAVSDQKVERLPTSTRLVTGESSAYFATKELTREKRA